MDIRATDNPHHVAVVGGGTGDLGRAVVAILQQHTSWTIVVPYRTPPKDPLPDDVHGIALPIGSGNIDLLDEQIRPLGTWTTCISCIGAFALGTVEETTPEGLAAQLESNLVAPWMLTRAAAHAMRESHTAGSISVVLSAAATMHARGQAAYQVTKSAALRMTELLAMELEHDQITVNGVLPTIIDTPANRADMPNADHGSWTPPERIAQLLLWLSSPESSHVTGAMLPIR